MVFKDYYVRLGEFCGPLPGFCGDRRGILQIEMEYTLNSNVAAS